MLCRLREATLPVSVLQHLDLAAHFCGFLLVVLLQQIKQRVGGKDQVQLDLILLYIIQGQIK